MGPALLGQAGKLVFGFGNAPESDGAVLAGVLIQHGWKAATAVTDKLLACFTDGCQNFSTDLPKVRGHVVSQLP